MFVLDLVHQVREKNKFVETSSSSNVFCESAFVVTGVTCQNANGVVIVDDRGLGWNESVLEQEARAEAMNVSNVDFVPVFIGNLMIDSFGHASRGTIGESETEHVSIGKTLAMGLLDALGQDLSFTASGRCQHQMVTLLQSNDTGLTCIGCPI